MRTETPQTERNKHLTIFPYSDIQTNHFFDLVEHIERSLDPLTTNLVVADESRTGKTICLTVSFHGTTWR